jgi:hypothetical protein
MTNYNIFTDDAKVVDHSEHGPVQYKAVSPRLYRSLESGKAASAILHADGTFSGFFEDDGHVFEVKARNSTAANTNGPSLLEGGARASQHVVQRHRFAHLFGRVMGELPRSLRASLTTPLQDSSTVGDTPQLVRDNAEELAGLMSSTDYPALIDWDGTKWWGLSGTSQCFPGDESPHEFVIGVIADVPATCRSSTLTSWKIECSKFVDNHENVKNKMLVAIHQASFIFYKQLHIAFKVGYLKSYSTTSDAPGWADDCDDDDIYDSKLNGMKDDTSVEWSGLIHLFTGCYNHVAQGTVGIAWVGTVCRTDGYNTGVTTLNNVHGGESWGTFAHEMGHNFGADHSFENGQGTTGGIMDYGDGKLDGIYQFHTELRKAQMCKTIRDMKNCSGKFYAVDAIDEDIFTLHGGAFRPLPLTVLFLATFLPVSLL